MDEGPETSADALPDDCTRTEAVDLFWQMAKRIALQMQELRTLQRTIGERWGRAPHLPKWDGARPGARHQERDDDGGRA
jgi:hypothetical protein